MSSLSTTMLRLGLVCMAGWLVAFGSSAKADTFVKFYTDAGNTHGYAGEDFSSPGTLYADMTSGTGTYVATACPSSGSCTSALGDNIQTTLSFNSLGLVASASTGMKVWDDLAPNFGGLGVGTGSSGIDTNDQINGTNVLTLTFSSPIILTGVATLFDAAHTPFGNGDPLTSGFLLNGAFVSFANANDKSLHLMGTTFTFAEDGSNDPQFYVSGLAYTSATPIPGALPLFASGLAAMGMLYRRRKPKTAPAISAA
jgi:hypothetical protein